MTLKNNCYSCDNYGKLKMVDGKYYCQDCLAEKFPDKAKRPKDEGARELE